jgi:hypothetical protein
MRGVEAFLERRHRPDLNLTRGEVAHRGVDGNVGFQTAILAADTAVTTWHIQVLETFLEIQQLMFAITTLQHA